MRTFSHDKKFVYLNCTGRYTFISDGEIQTQKNTKRLSWRMEN